jgi:hypothetical protein
MKLNPGKSNAVSFKKAWVKDPLNYSFGDQRILEARSCKYLGIIIHNDLNCADQVNYTVQKTWKALHFIMRILKKRYSNTKSLAYTSLVRPILEYGAACSDRYWEGQVNTLDCVQKKEAKFANHTNNSVWEPLVQHRKIPRIFAPSKRTPENGHGKLEGTGYNDHAT